MISSEPNKSNGSGAEQPSDAEQLSLRKGEGLSAASGVPVRSGVLESLSKAEVEKILERARAEAAAFVERTGLAPVAAAKKDAATKDAVKKDAAKMVSLTCIPKEQMEKFGEWYDKSGRKEMGELAEALKSFIREIDLQGHPGHDRRHILIQDPMVGLGFIGSTVNDEKIEGVRTLFLLPSLFHDLGRLMEPSLGRPDPDISLEGEVARDHAIISFLYLKGFLEKHAPAGMPEKLKDHLLFSVLVHAQGDYPNHLFAHLTQSCDRSQIYGAEGLRRMLACDVGIRGIGIYPASREAGYPDELKSYGGELDPNLTAHIEYFIRTGHPFRGRDELLETSARIVYLMVQGTEYEQRFFAPELARERREPIPKSWSPLQQQIWEAAKSEPPGMITERIEALRAKHEKDDLTALALAFVEAPGAASMSKAKASVKPEGQSADCVLSDRINAVPDDLKRNLREALLYSLAMLEVATDAPQQTGLQHSEPFVRGVAEIVAEAVLKSR